VVLLRATSAVTKRVQRSITRHGLTPAEFGVLEALYHRGPMLLGEVQRRILVSSGGITFIVDRLAAKGLVSRRECSEDRRARYAPTPAGAVHDRIFRARQEHRRRDRRAGA
jgi:MarR family 2-MHQ and catechol resistance regulon transcriptional repressor